MSDTGIECDGCGVSYPVAELTRKLRVDRGEVIYDIFCRDCEGGSAA